MVSIVDNLDRTCVSTPNIKPNHVARCVSRWQLVYFINSIKLDQILVLTCPSLLQLFNWEFSGRDHPDHTVAQCVRSIDRFSHNMSSTSEIRAVRLLFFLDKFFSPSLDSPRSCVRWPCLRPNASSAIIIILQFLFYNHQERGPRRSQPRQCGVLPCFSRVFLLRYVRRDLTFVHSSAGTCINEFSVALPRIELLGFHGSSTQIVRNFFCPKHGCQKVVSPLSSVCCMWCQQKELIRFLVLASKHSFLFHRNISFVSSASWFLNKQLAPHCTSSLS